MNIIEPPVESGTYHRITAGIVNADSEPIMVPDKNLWVIPSKLDVTYVWGPMAEGDRPYWHLGVMEVSGPDSFSVDPPTSWGTRQFQWGDPDCPMEVVNYTRLYGPATDVVPVIAWEKLRDTARQVCVALASPRAHRQIAAYRKLLQDALDLYPYP